MSPTVVHVTASRSYGGPERQMLGTARALAPTWEPVFLSFAEDGRCTPFLDAARDAGFRAIGLQHDTPHLWAARGEIVRRARDAGAAIVGCHGYKADLVGAGAARRLGVPVFAVSHGWTGESLRVRVYEALDRWALRRVDHVVAVSEAQAVRVRAAGVDPSKVTVIRNAVDPERFAAPHGAQRDGLRALVASDAAIVVGAAGRLSPEKGFDVLVDAAAIVRAERADVAFVLFGDGALEDDLRRRVRELGLEASFAFAGYRPDLEAHLGHLDIFVLSSFTEGLPVVVLEAMAAGVAVVSTSVGGVPEVVEDGVTGRLVPSGDAARLAQAILDLAADDATRRSLGARGRERVVEAFTFETQAERYAAVFDRMVRRQPPNRTSLVRRLVRRQPPNRTSR